MNFDHTLIDFAFVESIVLRGDSEVRRYEKTVLITVYVMFMKKLHLRWLFSAGRSEITRAQSHSTWELSNL